MSYIRNVVNANVPVEIDDITYPHKNLFGIPFFSGTYKQAVLLLINEMLRQDYKARVVVTPNVDHIVRLSKDKDFFNLYRSSDYFFPDGFPIIVSSRILLKPLTERVTGADLFPEICSQAAKYNRRIFILGGLPHSEKFIKDFLEQKFLGAEFNVYSPSMDFQYDENEGRQALELVNSCMPDLVFCCLGMPKQEKWALSYRNHLNTNLVLCLGAALDFTLGLAHRAPRLFQQAGFEWLWRLCSDPRRLCRRYLYDDLLFFKLFVEELISNRSRGIFKKN
jgi:N-acetylglucosaminyldiphosphoundecaprenol N-acetyl-beta-D-mannosaminyltransferase